MSELAHYVIYDALQMIQVQAEEEPIEAPMAQLAIRVLNRMMARFKVRGIDVGYKNITNLKSTIAVPDGAIEAIVHNLALELWPHYRNEEVSNTINSLAQNGRDVLRILTTELSDMYYPTTLPMGSGNVGAGDYQFFSYEEDEDTDSDTITSTDGYLTDTAGNLIYDTAGDPIPVNK